MTDDQMDARLRRAGDNWRAATTTAAAPRATDDPLEHDVSGPPARANRRRTGLIASSILVAAAVVAAGIVLVNALTGKGTDHNQTATALVGTVWRFTGNGSQRSFATLVVTSAGRLVVDDECAVLGAKASARGGRLTVTKPDLRYRDCVDQTGPSLLTRGLDVLTSKPRYAINGTTLTIGALHFVAAPGIPAPTLDVPTFLGSHWQLVSVRDKNGVTIPTRSKPDLYVHAGAMQTSDGCNSLSGSVSVRNGRTIVPKDLATTEIGCPNDPSIALIDALLTKPFAPIVRGALATITTNGVGTLDYRWLPTDETATDPGSLTGTTWHLTSVATDPAVTGATLHVGTDGRITGNDGCRTITGTATIDVGTWRTTGIPEQPPTTCPKKARDQASTIDSFLHGGLWSVRNGRLILDGEGAQAFAVVFGSNAPPAAPGSVLLGKPWRLQSYEQSSGTANVSSASGASVTTEVVLIFSGASAQATVRCGRYDVTTSVAAHAINFSGRAFRTHSCPALGADQRAEEQHVDALLRSALEGSVRWSVHGGALTLTKGVTTLTFTG